MTFLEKLDMLMADQHINKPKLAELSGVPYTTIDAFYKKGYANAKISNIRKIAKALGVTLDYLIEESPENEKSPGLSTEAMKIAKDYDELDTWGRRTVRAVTDSELERTRDNIVELRPAGRIVPLLGNSFAAGQGEPDFGNMWADYEVPANSPADFAIKITGDSMEPYLPDGSIQLCKKTLPQDGEIGAFLIDGEYICKQICVDIVGTLHLFSLNRERKDLDRHIKRDDIDRQVLCFGTVMTPRRPLPLD